MLDQKKEDALYILEQNFKDDSCESYKTDYNTDDNKETARGKTLQSLFHHHYEKYGGGQLSEYNFQFYVLFLQGILLDVEAVNIFRKKTAANPSISATMKILRLSGRIFVSANYHLCTLRRCWSIFFGPSKLWMRMFQVLIILF